MLKTPAFAACLALLGRGRREQNFGVQFGEFGADMQVFSQNDGPVTVLFDTG